MATNGKADVPSPTSLDDLSFRQKWAAFQIRQNLGEIQNGINALPNANSSSLTAIKDSLYDGNDTAPPVKVCIVGAGAAGLFTGMIFDFLKKTYGLKVDYEIVEANPEGCVGGRLFTYKFPDTGDDEHQYYDVGAMRFPKIDIMERTYALFDTLKMYEVESQDVKTAKKRSLIPYYLISNKAPALYNGVQVVGDTKKTADAFNIKDIPQQYRDKDPDELVNSTIQAYLNQYKKYGPKTFWDLLMDQGDKYTVRQYLAQQASYDYNTIEFLETLSLSAPIRQPPSQTN